jgi:hypothetical protein
LFLIKNGVCAGGCLKRIEAVLRHFTLEQLADIVIPDFQILSWHNVRRKIIHEQHPLNKNSIIRFLVFAVKVMCMEMLMIPFFSISVTSLKVLNIQVF